MVIWILLGGVALLCAVALHDLFQRKHAILRTFPLLGHFRFLFEAVGPELRQYIVTGNDEERPFNRDQRRWVYASAKRENNYFHVSPRPCCDADLGPPTAKPSADSVLPFESFVPHAAAMSSVLN